MAQNIDKDDKIKPGIEFTRKDSAGPNSQKDVVKIKIVNQKGSKSHNDVRITSDDDKKEG